MQAKSTNSAVCKRRNAKMQKCKKKKTTRARKGRESEQNREEKSAQDIRMSFNPSIHPCHPIHPSSVKKILFLFSVKKHSLILN
jgi:hypothetical protein